MINKNPRIFRRKNHFIFRVVIWPPGRPDFANLATFKTVWLQKFLSRRPTRFGYKLATFQSVWPQKKIWRRPTKIWPFLATFGQNLKVFKNVLLLTKNFPALRGTLVSFLFFHVCFEQLPRLGKMGSKTCCHISEYFFTFFHKNF